jgi:hypothetical protein
MGASFTVRDLVRAGGPLGGAEVLAAEGDLGNPVIWAVSLRPYAPAIPPIKGGEIALAGVETLSRQGITQASVVEMLAQLGAAGFAIKGEVDGEAIEVARRVSLPLLKIGGEVALHEIEQEIIRECALFQARREVFAPQEPWTWIETLVAGETIPAGDIEAQARRDNYTLPAKLAVAIFLPRDGKPKSTGETGSLLATLRKPRSKGEPRLATCEHEGGVLALLPSGSDEAVEARQGWACGIGTEKPPAQAHESLEEARSAALVSARLRDGAPTRYDRLGADRLLVLLYKESREELRVFVRETLGTLLDHDARYATHLLPTVEAFAMRAGRLRETAGEIYVHRNTLAYRLERASEILDHDLKDPDTLLNVALALRAMRLLDEGRKAKDEGS